MVSPVTGPFTKTVSLPGNPNRYGFVPQWLYKKTTWYRQRKPYSLPLGYDMQLQWVSGFTPGYDNIDYVSTSDVVNANLTWDWVVSAQAKAYSKLVEELGDASLWAVNIAEHKQATAMVLKRTSSLLKAARRLNRFDIFGAARELGVRWPSGRGPIDSRFKPGAKQRILKLDPRRDPKAIGNLWLEFHFGWEPLIKDIHAGIKTLTSPIPQKRIVGRGSSRYAYAWRESPSAPDNVRQSFRDNFEAKVRCQADVRVTNPNLFTAQQLGFVNPAVVAWELVPFSFVLDWFVNVGQVLSSFTDFAGTTLVNPSTTTYVTTFRDGTLRRGGSFSLKGVRVVRSLAISRPVLHIRPWKGVSVVRAATSISLLLQQLRR